MKYKHILFPTDGSEKSMKALNHVKTIASAFESQVTILCVYQQPMSISTNFSSLPPEIYEQYKQDNHKQAQKLAREVSLTLSNFGVNVDIKIEEGNPKLVICDQVTKLGCDLIIMGSKGYTASNYIGSTSTHVINHTPEIPVMVVS